MARLPFRPSFLVLLPLVSACGGTSDSSAADEASAPQYGAPAAVSASGGVDASIQTGSAAGAGVALTTSAPPLRDYLGRYLGEKVNGMAWENHPSVIAGIAASVGDADVRRAITTTAGPSAPIEMINGNVSSWACEQHNCGDHQWMVMVSPDSGATDVCFFDAAKLADKARWYLADGRLEERAGNCTHKE